MDERLLGRHIAAIDVLVEVNSQNNVVSLLDSGLNEFRQVETKCLPWAYILILCH